EADAVRRVLRWAMERFQAKGTPPSSSADGLEKPASRNFTEIHELFDAANPTTGIDRALVAAYWFQAVLQHEDLDSQDINKELKHLGHPSKNITRDLDHLINRTPRYVMQVKKQGTTKQARKRYKLTREGIRAVERMLEHSPSDGDSTA